RPELGADSGGTWAGIPNDASAHPLRHLGADSGVTRTQIPADLGSGWYRRIRRATSLESGPVRGDDDLAGGVTKKLRDAPPGPRRPAGSSRRPQERPPPRRESRSDHVRPSECLSRRGTRRPVLRLTLDRDALLQVAQAV